MQSMRTQLAGRIFVAAGAILLGALMIANVAQALSRGHDCRSEGWGVIACQTSDPAPDQCIGRRGKKCP
jgi:hypothetical protein